MVSVAPQLIQEVTAHAQSDSLEDAREICADGTYFPNNLRISVIPQNMWLLIPFSFITVIPLADMFIAVTEMIVHPY